METITQQYANGRNRLRKNGTASIGFGDVKSKITAKRLFRASFLYQTKEFFNNSTLHGVRYIAETNRPFGERLMWFCFTAIGFISALVVIVSLWEKFQTNPTITGLDMNAHYQRLVFPTIAVCPIEPYEMNRTVDLASEILGNTEEDEISAESLASFLKYLPQLTFENMGITFKQTDNISENDKYNVNIDSRSLRTYTFQIGIYCNETFDVCKYKDEEIKCCDHFYPVYSEHGLCYLFNPRYIDQAVVESVNNIYQEIFEIDKKWALFFTPKREARIFVHSHLENFGWDFRPHLIWEPDFSAELLISMKQTYTTEDAKQLSIVQRKCIFPDEIKLDYYEGEYTFTNCMKECRIKNCLKFCDCIPPFYRPIRTLEYCKTKDLICLARHFSNITDVRSCQRCELNCANTVYEIEKLNKIMTVPLKPLDNYVNIEFLSWPIVRYKREVLFGWVDLLISFGGIAGLFLGFSLLSGVEIIYYFTLRTLCMFHKNRHELHKIEENHLMQPLKLSKNTKELAAIRRIEVAEISSNIKNDLRNRPNNHLQDTFVESSENQTKPKNMTRTAKKMLSIQQLNNQNRVATSYDYAHSNGPYYMP